LKLPIVAIALAASLLAQQNPAGQAARQWRQQHERAIVDEFVELLKVPNLSRDREGIQRNADLIAAMLERHGVPARLLTADGANPIVFGSLTTPGATRTLVFYAHYDGQPLDPKEWATPPFEPTLRDKPLEDGGRIIPLPQPGERFDPESRLYARSAGDDKAPIIAMLAGLDALRAAGLRLKSNVKFVFEGEEENSSTNLSKMLAANKALVAGDLWIMCDGPVHQTRRQLLYFGARDSARIDVTVYGPKNELHSGHYGNWAPNPAMMLARLLVSMRDETGHVLVDHFYDQVERLGAVEKRALADAPDIDADLMHELWLGSTEGAPKKLVELITQPALNVRGMASSRIGAQASNVIPSSASATLDIRLVKAMDPAKTQQLVVDHIRRQGYFIVEHEPTAEERQSHPMVARIDRGHAGFGAVRTPMDLPIAQEVIRVVESVRGKTVALPTMGGTLPLADVERPLGTRTIVVPIANHDDDQHSFNENLRIQNLWDGIELMAALMAM
jgi:acetylornithine deacetylase/succinyl-diaminopimelate desuccinylase-like protein